MKADLASALATLEESDEAGALDALLDVWRATGAPSVADAIDALSERITARLPPVTAVGSTSAKKAWEQLAAQRRAVDLGRLLAVLPDGNDRALRLRALLAWERDPRIATAARAWLTAPPVAGARRRSFFVPLIELLAHVADTRLVPVLNQATTKEARSRTIHHMSMQAWKPLVALAHTLSTQPVASSSAEDEGVLEKIRARIGRPKAKPDVDPAALFAEVYAHPEADEPRAVLGDLLQQLGDPRGEFIALQLARAGTNGKRTSRERELEETWARKWLGALDPALLAGGIVFERGFLARCRYGGASAGAATKGAPEWSTVTHVDASTASGYISYSHEVLLDPVMRALRHVVGVAREDLVEIMRARPLPWQTIGVRMYRWSNVDPLAGGPGHALREVRRLVLAPAHGQHVDQMTPDVLATLLAQWPQLEQLELTVRPDQVAPMATAARSVPRLMVHTAEATYELEGRALRIVFETMRESASSSAAAHLRALAAARPIEAVTVRSTSPVKRVGDELVRGPRFPRLPLRPLFDAAQEAGASIDVATGSIE
ncbi:MAG: TIGR02996 domain-containing protein [Polyangiales bacterium]